MARNVKDSVVNLLWGRAAGHCELCGNDVTGELLAGVGGKFGQVAHIQADAPGGARYNRDQSEEERNSVENLMLLCHACHKLVDDHPADYGVAFLQRRKADYEDAVRRAVDAIGPAYADVVTLVMQVGSTEFEVADKDYREALVDAGIRVGREKPCDLARRLPGKSLLESLAIIGDNLTEYYRVIHDASRRTAVFAIAPQPILIGLGRLLHDDGVVVFQKRRDADGWSWVESGPTNGFRLEEPGGTEVEVRTEDCAVVLGVSDEIPCETYARALPDPSCPVYTLRAAEVGVSAICSKEDWHAFKEAATGAVFRIHRQHPEVRRLHVFPAMPVSACVAFGMAWNDRLIPEMIVYEKKEGTFGRVLSIGGPDGFSG